MGISQSMDTTWRWYLVSKVFLLLKEDPVLEVPAKPQSLAPSE